MRLYLGILSLFILDRLAKLVFILNPSWLPSPAGFFNFSVNPQLVFSWPMITWLYYPLAAVILFLLFHQAHQSIKNKDILAWPWSLIIIGAISNLLDRLYYGGVVDFISIPGLIIFNISDIYISVGVVWLLWNVGQKKFGQVAAVDNYKGKD